MFPYAWLFRYDEKDEEFGGVYWQFLELDRNEIRNNITLGVIIDFFSQIKNEELRERMKVKVAEIIDFSDLNANYKRILELGLLKHEEIEGIIAKELEVISKNKREDGMEVWYREPEFSRISSIIQECTSGRETEQFELIDDLLRRIETSSQEKNEEALKSIYTYIIMRVRNESVKERLIQEHYERLSESGKKLVLYNQDPEYIRKKAMDFKGIRIGLNPKMTIGCEIEANNRLLSNLVEIEKHAKDYHISAEGTIGTGNEFVTPVFLDTEDDVAMFCAVCDTLTELGYYYDEELGLCGGHINIGLHYLDTANSILNFYEIYGSAEEVLFRICNKENQMIRQNIDDIENSFFQPISGKIGKKEIDEAISREELIELFANDGYGSSSMLGIQGKKASVCIRNGERLEVRMPNGGADYKVWLDNIRLFGRIVEVSKEIDDIMQRGPQTEREYRMLELKESLKEEKSLEEKLFDLMDLLFEDDEIKQIYTDRFYSVERAMRLEKEMKEEYTREELKKIEYNRRLYKDNKGVFGIVDFERIYHTRILHNGEFDKNYIFTMDYVPDEHEQEEKGSKESAKSQPEIMQDDKSQEDKTYEDKMHDESIGVRENVGDLGDVVEKYSRVYGITMSDLKRTHTQFERMRQEEITPVSKTNDEKDEI